MIAFLLRITGLVFLWGKIGLRIQDMPGNPDSETERAITVLTARDLQNEFPDELPSTVLVVFSEAAELQRQRNYEAARVWYEVLRHIPIEGGGEYDLVANSSVIQHNLALMSNNSSV